MRNKEVISVQQYKHLVLFLCDHLTITTDILFAIDL